MCCSHFQHLKFKSFVARKIPKLKSQLLHVVMSDESIFYGEPFKFEISFILKKNQKSS